MRSGKVADVGYNRGENGGQQQSLQQTQSEHNPEVSHESKR